MGKSQRKNPHYRPKCWTEHLNKHQLEDTPRHVLCQRDINSRYTVTHALASSGMPAEELRRKFQYLEDQNLMGKLTAKDRDGDVPLQSAVYSGADRGTICLILTYFLAHTRIMLENRNRHNETAIERFEHMKVEGFKLILETCLRVGAVLGLTCIGDQNKPCTSLLHMFIRGRHVQYLGAFLEVCRDKKAEINLCCVDEKGHTAWHYLVLYKESEIDTFDNILNVLSQYNIDLNDLLAKKKSKETMLHQAYRLKKWVFIRRLENACGETVDRFNRKPQQRDRRLNLARVQGNEAQPDPQVVERIQPVVDPQPQALPRVEDPPAPPEEAGVQPPPEPPQLPPETPQLPLEPPQLPPVLPQLPPVLPQLPPGLQLPPVPPQLLPVVDEPQTIDQAHHPPPPRPAPVEQPPPQNGPMPLPERQEQHALVIDTWIKKTSEDPHPHSNQLHWVPGTRYPFYPRPPPRRTITSQFHLYPLTLPPRRNTLKNFV